MDENFETKIFDYLNGNLSIEYNGHTKEVNLLLYNPYTGKFETISTALIYDLSQDE